MRKKFRVEMQKLHTLLLEMDMAIKKNIDLMIKAISFNDFKLAKQVVDNDDFVDRLEMKIENFCIDILVRQQPVAGDLREVTAVLKMITDLERISDYCASVCEHFIDNKETNNNSCTDLIISLCKNAKTMFVGMIESYLEQDSSKIVTVTERDSISDKLYKELKQFVVENEKNLTLPYILNITLMGKSLERMADHITNVCEYINFKITGSFKI